MAEDDPHNLPDRFDRRPVINNSNFTDLDAFAEEQADSDGFDFKALWNIFWPSRYWILGAGALGLALALGYSLFQTPLYRSSATLELNPPNISVVGNAGSDENMIVPQTDWQFQETQLGLLKSRDLAKRVVEDLNLASKQTGEAASAPLADRVDMLAGQIRGGIAVETNLDSRLVSLAYTSDNPATAAQIVNSYARSYIQSNLDRKYEATSAARDFLKQRLETTRTALNNAELNLVKYAKQNNIVETGSPDSEGNGGETLSTNSLVSLNSALAEAQQKRIAAEQRFRQSSSITEVNQSAAALREQKALLEAEYKEKKTYLKDNFPAMVRLRSRIESLDQAIRRESGNASGSLRGEYRAALAEEQALQKRVSQLTGNVLAERDRSVQYNMLQRELDTNRSQYAALLERYNKIDLAGDYDTPPANIVDLGQVPGAPFSPNIPRNLILGLIFGLGLGATLAFVYQTITDTIRSADDIREKLGLAVLGIIPKLKSGEDLSEELSNPMSLLSEAYLSLMATMQFSTNSGFPKALLVTSTLSSEGKSTTSLILAKQLGQQGKKVLLIDADMRKPSFIVDERGDIGLARLLISRDPIGDHIVGTALENLSLMPSGPMPPNPAQLLNSYRMENIMCELLKAYDHVIVDGPPSHGFADTALLGAMCNGVLFAIESGKIRKNQALDVISRLRSNHNNICGAVLTKGAVAAGAYDYSSAYNNQDDLDSKRKALKTHELTPTLLFTGQD